jgi:hypothetical protein
MSIPSPHRGPLTQTPKSRGRPLGVLELSVLLDELDRVVGELEESLNELVLPFDEASRGAACDAISAARHRA